MAHEEARPSSRGWRLTRAALVVGSLALGYALCWWAIAERLMVRSGGVSLVSALGLGLVALVVFGVLAVRPATDAREAAFALALAPALVAGVRVLSTVLRLPAPYREQATGLGVMYQVTSASIADLFAATVLTSAVLIWWALADLAAALARGRREGRGPSLPRWPRWVVVGAAAPVVLALAWKLQVGGLWSSPPLLAAFAGLALVAASRRVSSAAWGGAAVTAMWLAGRLLIWRREVLNHWAFVPPSEDRVRVISADFIPTLPPLVILPAIVLLLAWLPALVAVVVDRWEPPGPGEPRRRMRGLLLAVVATALIALPELAARWWWQS